MSRCAPQRRSQPNNAPDTAAATVSAPFLSPVVTVAANLIGITTAFTASKSSFEVPQPAAYQALSDARRLGCSPARSVVCDPTQARQPTAAVAAAARELDEVWAVHVHLEHGDLRARGPGPGSGRSGGAWAWSGA